MCNEIEYTVINSTDSTYDKKIESDQPTNSTHFINMKKEEFANSYKSGDL